MATLDLMRVGGRNSRWESAVAFEYNYFLAKLSVFTKFNRVSPLQVEIEIARENLTDYLLVFLFYF